MRLIILTSLILIWLSSSVDAQTSVDKRINGTFIQSPLRQVLKAIDAQTDVHIVFSDALVGDIAVSSELHDVTPDEALQIILKGTGLSFRKSKERQYIILRDAGTSSRTISGRVIDALRGEILVYATVHISGTKLITRTNTAGYFTMVNVPMVPCTLQVRYIGYQTANIFLTSNMSMDTVRIALYPEPLSSNGVTVQADELDIMILSDVAGAHTIDVRQFDNLPGLYQKDMSRVLQQIPGITTSDARASGLSIRGSSPNENLLLLDGMPLYQLDHGFGLFSALNSNIIKNLNVYKGGFPARFGGRLSGVMDVTTKSGDFHTPHVNVSIDPLSAQGTIELPLAGRGGILISGRRSYTNRLLGDQLNRVFRLSDFSLSRGNLNQVDLRFEDIFGKLSYLPTDKDQITLTLYTGENGASLERRDSRVGLSVLTDTKRWGNRGYSGSWYHQWHPKFNSRIMIGYTDFFLRSDRSNVSTFQQEGSNETVGFENGVNELTLNVHNTWKTDTRHTIEWGGLLTYNRIIVEGTGLTTRNYNQEDYRYDFDFMQNTPGYSSSAFIEDTWQPNVNIDIKAGLRWNVAPFTDAIDWAPRFSVRFHPQSALSINAGWSVHHQYILPTLNSAFGHASGLSYWFPADGNQSYPYQRIYNIDGQITTYNNNLRQTNRPARAIHSILGMQYKNNRVLLSVEGYHKHLDKVLGLTHSESVSNVDNLKGYVRGLDFMMMGKISSYTQWVGYSSSQARIKRPLFFESEYPMNWDRPHSIKLGNTYTLGLWDYINHLAVWYWYTVYSQKF